MCCAHSFLWKIFISLDCRHSTYIFGHLILDQFSRKHLVMHLKCFLFCSKALLLCCSFEYLPQIYLSVKAPFNIPESFNSLVWRPTSKILTIFQNQQVSILFDKNIKDTSQPARWLFKRNTLSVFINDLGFNYLRSNLPCLIIAVRVPTFQRIFSNSISFL